MEEMGPHGGRANQVLGAVEGRALECLGKARLTVTLGTRVVEWGFIVAEIRDDEGILGNDFAMQTSSRCGHARVPCISRTSPGQEEDTWANVYHAPAG